MAKKHFGRFLTFAAIAGAAAAGISYFLQYKSFHKELDEDFHDFEDDFEEFEDTDEKDTAAVTRNYVSLTPERKSSEEEDGSDWDTYEGKPETGEKEEVFAQDQDSMPEEFDPEQVIRPKEDPEPEENPDPWHGYGPEAKADKTEAGEAKADETKTDEAKADALEEKKDSVPNATVTVEEMTE